MALTIKSVEGPANTAIRVHPRASGQTPAAVAAFHGWRRGRPRAVGWSPNPSAAIIAANNVTIDGFTLPPALRTARPRVTASTTRRASSSAARARAIADFLGQANGAAVQNSRTLGDVLARRLHLAFQREPDPQQRGGGAHHRPLGRPSPPTMDGSAAAVVTLATARPRDNLHCPQQPSRTRASPWEPGRMGRPASTPWTSNAGSAGSAATAIAQVGVAYAHGPVIIGCNTGGFWQSNTDNVLRVTGLNYTGLIEPVQPGTVALSARLVFDGG